MPSPIRSTMVLLSVSAIACSNTPSASLTGPRVVVTPQGLEQTVRLSPAEPATGDTLVITSTVVNGTGAAVDVTSRICGIDVETALKLAGPNMACAGYSMHGELAPGDSLLGSALGTVASGPGTYVLRVRHLLNPDVWVEIPITVR